MDRNFLHGPIMVGYDCRPGDVIRIEGKNARVVNTYPEGVQVSFNDDSRLVGYTYDALRDSKVEYVAMLLPVIPPMGGLTR